MSYYHIAVDLLPEIDTLIVKNLLKSIDEGCFSKNPSLEDPIKQLIRQLNESYPQELQEIIQEIPAPQQQIIQKYLQWLDTTSCRDTIGYSLKMTYKNMSAPMHKNLQVFVDENVAFVLCVKKITDDWRVCAKRKQNPYRSSEARLWILAGQGDF